MRTACDDLDSDDELYESFVNCTCPSPSRAACNEACSGTVQQSK